MPKTIIIQASSRSKGDSSKITQFLQSKIDFDLLDLNTLKIEHYDYNYSNEKDDFLSTVTTIASNYENIIFITPIYWYTMSGLLKVFLDRFSDLLKVHKDIGRSFRGKTVGLISVNNSEAYLKHFEEPIELSCQYLGMNFKSYVHAPVIDNQINPTSQIELIEFGNSFK
ncbi:flavodoxin family protein [Urechidicola sp. KH5]